MPISGHESVVREPTKVGSSLGCTSSMKRSHQICKNSWLCPVSGIVVTVFVAVLKGWCQGLIGPIKWTILIFSRNLHRERSTNTCLYSKSSERIVFISAWLALAVEWAPNTCAPRLVHMRSIPASASFSTGMANTVLLWMITAKIKTRELENLDLAVTHTHTHIHICTHAHVYAHTDKYNLIPQCCKSWI